MSGLVAYISSDEDEVEVTDATNSAERENHDMTGSCETNSSSEVQAPIRPRAAPEIESGPINGPVLGPKQPSDIAASPITPQEQGPSSPYSASRALIQDLTLPSVPNLEIPPSPPGSPDPIASGKTAQFLSLKKKGVHFNEKLAASSSLKNPSLFLKLCEHTGINNESQYATTLPADVWDHKNLPAWACKEELNRMQQAIRSKIEEAKQTDKSRSAIEFISSTARHA